MYPCTNNAICVLSKGAIVDGDNAMMVSRGNEQVRSAKNAVHSQRQSSVVGVGFESPDGCTSTHNPPFKQGFSRLHSEMGGAAADDDAVVSASSFAASTAATASLHDSVEHSSARMSAIVRDGLPPPTDLAVATVASMSTMGGSDGDNDADDDGDVD
jgi:hypothetical protein